VSSNFTVVYDACVLYPAPLRDLLMHLALSDLYRAKWSDMIHDEWIRNVLTQHFDDFIVDLLDLHPASVMEGVANHRRSLKNPPKSVEEYLDTLSMQGLTQSAAILRQWAVAV